MSVSSFLQQESYTLLWVGATCLGLASTPEIASTLSRGRGYLALTTLWAILQSAATKQEQHSSFTVNLLSQAFTSCLLIGGMMGSQALVHHYFPHLKDFNVAMLLVGNVNLLLTLGTQSSTN